MSIFPHDKKEFVNQYMAEKAGMSTVDKDKIAEIIQKLTQGSPKSLYEQELNQKREIELAQMLKKVFNFSTQQKNQIKTDWQQEINKMNSQRNLTCYWAHFDFDMFYVACELLDKPQLKEKPVAVGGEHSVICTANYIARKYGVRSALPTFIANKLCPELVLIAPDFSKYKTYSTIFRDRLRRYDPNLQSMGLDEAYVELTDYIKQKTKQQQDKFINDIRQDIFYKTGLTVSCGVGANKMLAKLASEENKPNGQFILQNNQSIILNFMKSKKIRKIPGIGPVNQFFLKGLGIQTAEDILLNTDVLTICFSNNNTEFYISRALGLGAVEHEFVQRKSLGKSQTFKATNDQKYLTEKVYQICEQVSMQLNQLGYVTQNIVFSYQNQKYSKKDKTFQLKKYSSIKDQLFQPILPYLSHYLQTTKDKIRLLGARCTKIIKIQELKKIQLNRFFIKPQLQIQSNTQKNTQDKHSFGSMLQFPCPICQKQIDCKGNLSAFNRHVDKCMANFCEAQKPAVIKCHEENNGNNESKDERQTLVRSKEKHARSQSKNKKLDGSLLSFFRKS